MKMRNVIMAACLVVLAARGWAAEETKDSPKLKVAAVTASAAESKAAGGFGDFGPEKTIDGDMKADSSWRAEVTDEKKGQWIQYDLGEAKAVTAVRIAFLNGDKRVYKFDIELSEDGEKWTAVFAGKSSGKDKSFETFEAAGKARYVRIKGYGINREKFPKWINIVETEIVGEAAK